MHLALHNARNIMLHLSNYFYNVQIIFIAAIYDPSHFTIQFPFPLKYSSKGFKTRLVGLWTQNNKKMISVDFKILDSGQNLSAWFLYHSICLFFSFFKSVFFSFYDIEQLFDSLNSSENSCTTGPWPGHLWYVVEFCILAAHTSTLTFNQHDG